MSKISGNGPIYLGSNAALHMGSWSLNGNNESVGDYDLVDNSKQVDYGAQSYTGSCTGVAALEDTTGQDLLLAAFTNKTKITDIKFYEVFTAVSAEKTVHWSPVSGAGGLVFTSMEISKDGGSETSKISFSFECDGLMERVVTTVS